MNKIKILTLATGLLMAFSACNKSEEAVSNDGYQSKGKIKSGEKGVKVILEESVGEQYIIRDSATVGDDSSFTFSGKISEPNFYRVSFNNGQFVYLALDNTEKVQIEVSKLKGAFEYKILGSRSNNYVQQVNAWDAEFQTLGNIYSSKYGKADAEKDEVGKARVLASYDSAAAKFQGKIKNLIDTAQNSIVLISFANMYLDFNKDLAYAEKLDERFKKAYPNSKIAKIFTDRVAKEKTLAIGAPAPDFELTTPEGKKFKLSSLKGKLVLIDFWASWCKPCRKSNPEVVKIYNTYHAKGLEIVGVSLDNDAKAWTDAIKQDKLTWIHVSDLQEWKSAVVPLYNIDGIPFTILIGKDGKILSKRLSAAELSEKIAKSL